jgi:capsular polysaccharide biosynthesis protein
MATLQVCYRDASGQLKCYPPSATTTMSVTTAAKTKPDFAAIVQMIRDLVKNEGKDGVQPDVVNILYIADPDTAPAQAE